MERKEIEKLLNNNCKGAHRAIQDTLEVVNGKWKLPILSALFEGKKRFRELVRELGISPRMLSKELQEMEMNKLVRRTVCETKPITVEYEKTEYSDTLWDVILAMRVWGFQHRDKIIGGLQRDEDVSFPEGKEQ